MINKITNKKFKTIDLYIIHNHLFIDRNDFK